MPVWLKLCFKKKRKEKTLNMFQSKYMHLFCVWSPQLLLLLLFSLKVMIYIN